MILVFGTHSGFTELGNVADFCPICLQLRCFKLFRHTKRGHVYGVKVGAGQSAGDFVSCLTCGAFYPVDSTKFKEPCAATDLDGAIQASFPNIREHHADRLDCEVRIREQRLTDDDQRRFLLAEPFRFLDYVISTRAHGRMQMDRVSSIGCAASLIFCVLVKIGLSLLDKGEWFETAFGAAFIAVVIAFAIMRLEPRRHARKTLQPVLARVLSRLHPTEAELKRTLAQLRDEGLYVGKCFSARGLLQEMKSLPVASSGTEPEVDGTTKS